MCIGRYKMVVRSIFCRFIVQQDERLNNLYAFHLRGYCFYLIKYIPGERQNLTYYNFF